MIHRVNTFINQRGKKIFTQEWIPESDIKAAVLLIHGYAGHSGRFKEFANKLVKQKYAVFALDLQGFGRSDGTAADIEDFDDYVKDTTIYLENLQKEFSDLPLFLMGHSMGGNIALITAAQNDHQLNGLILSAPALKAMSNLPKVIQDMANYISAFAATIPVLRMDIEVISRDTKVIEEFKKDPLSYNGRIRARMANQLAKGSEKAREAALKITYPVWIGHGTDDKLIDPKGTHEFNEIVPSEEITCHLYEGLYHDILHEPEKEKVTNDIISWLDEYTSNEVGEIVDKEKEMAK
ncbi:MAG TPA: lysophospholipase [Balneolales bacterium]|nr:lysophospholipase [Balneolales bacterium]